jgi:hypothetical protein
MVIIKRREGERERGREGEWMSGVPVMVVIKGQPLAAP